MRTIFVKMGSHATFFVNMIFFLILTNPSLLVSKPYKGESLKPAKKNSKDILYILLMIMDSYVKKECACNGYHWFGESCP